MKRTLSLIPALLLLVTACSNPADDAPQAVVGEPIEVNEPAEIQSITATPVADDALLAEPVAVSAALTDTATTDAALVLPPASADAELIAYTIAPESKIEWVGSKVTGSHDGGFRTFDGQILLDPKDPEGSQIRFNIDATSIWSDTDRLTNHLKSADFFEVETYPTATFESTSIQRTDTGFDVTGNLTLHGVTRGITFPAQVQVTSDTLHATSEFAIKRFDFDIKYPGKTDDLIRDDVLIRLDLTARQQIELTTDTQTTM